MKKRLNPVCWLIPFVSFCLVASFAVSYGKDEKQKENDPGTLKITIPSLQNVNGGAGLAILFETPDGKNYLFDTGNGSFQIDPEKYNSGRDTLFPILKRKGIHELDGVVISHAHFDHFGGFQWLLENIPIRNLYDPGYVLPGRDPHDYSGEIGLYAKLRNQYIQKHPNAYHKILGGDRLNWDSRLEVEVITPPKGYFTELKNEKRPKNDGIEHHLLNANALGMRIQHGDVVLLIIGDIQQDYLKEKLWPILPAEKKKCDICILPSHVIHSIPEEASATRPQVAIGSVWAPWAYRIRAWSVYQAVGSVVYVTGVNGDIEIISNGKEFRVRSERTFIPEPKK